MKKRVISSSLALLVSLPLGLSAGFAGPLSAARAADGHAAGEGVFNARQRAAIVDIVRDALKNDPSILSDAIQSIRQQASSHQEAQARAAVQANWAALSNAPSYAVRGNPHGKITIVEFLDPRCTYCRHMAPLVDQFLAKHDDIRLVEKVIPVLGEASVMESRAIYAAAFQGKYDAMRRQFMSENARPNMEHIRDVARSLELDLPRFEKDMSSPAVMGLLTANLGQAQSVGVQGTPTFLFGQVAIAPGALSLEQMEQFLDAARKG